MKHERECEICGAHYEYCPNCDSYAHLPRWMFLFHSKNCKNIYDIINDYRTGALNADKAKTRLSKLDMSGRDTFKAPIKKIIDEIWRNGTIEEPKRERNNEKK